MSDFYARQVIEALRSGVPSRAVGAYFSEARPSMQKKLREKLERVQSSERSEGMIVTGRYGEGKTHLLNSVFNMAFEDNMAVSMVSLGKETPVDKPYLLFQKLMANTYLPGATQPGFRSRLEEMTQGSSAAGNLLAYAAAELETDKLYYVLKALLGTQEEEERSALLADLEGDFTTAALIKRSCRRITGSPVKFRQNFTKTKHAMDYFYFTSHLIHQLGCSGWVILLDEAELIGRLGKKTRAKSYVQMQRFLNPPPELEHTFTLFAFSSSFSEDVIDKKHEFENAASVYAESPEERKKAEDTLNAILRAPELAPLNKDEIIKILLSIQEFHGRAYGWRPEISAETLYQSTEAGGYLLRTKIRAAIEFFDQLYQYGEAGKTKITELGEESFDEEVPELPEL
ncbi:MAG: DUF2791 family P-loop domain-containing protein [Lachnospiraceae bacterium]|nr:DUF2791 family P-loop domain-containing protein [Lachnospiraceae bacterium]